MTQCNPLSAEGLAAHHSQNRSPFHQHTPRRRTKLESTPTAHAHGPPRRRWLSIHLLGIARSVSLCVWGNANHGEIKKEQQSRTRTCRGTARQGNGCTHPTQTSRKWRRSGSGVRCRTAAPVCCWQCRIRPLRIQHPQTSQTPGTGHHRRRSESRCPTVARPRHNRSDTAECCTPRHPPRCLRSCTQRRRTGRAPPR